MHATLDQGLLRTSFIGGLTSLCLDIFMMVSCQPRVMTSSSGTRHVKNISILTSRSMPYWHQWQPWLTKIEVQVHPSKASCLECCQKKGHIMALDSYLHNVKNSDDLWPSLSSIDSIMSSFLSYKLKATHAILSPSILRSIYMRWFEKRHTSECLGSFCCHFVDISVIVWTLNTSPVQTEKRLY